MRETAPPQRNGRYTVFRTDGSLISSTLAAVCCFCVLLGAIAGSVYARSSFASWNTASAIIVGVERDDFEGGYCPRIQFETATYQNVTAVLETSCVDNPQFV